MNSKPRLAITGVVCGVRVETVEDPVMREIRYLDKLIDELAKGRPIGRIMRPPPTDWGRPGRCSAAALARCVIISGATAA